jgi:hypothetical protein
MTKGVRKSGRQKKHVDEPEEKEDDKESLDTRVCVICHSRLKIEPWNTSCDIIYCDNLGCEWYHRPQGSIKVSPRDMYWVNAAYK